MVSDHHIFEGLTIRNTEVAFWAGVKDVAGAKGLTMRRCRIENVGIGVTTQYAGSTDFYIADNVFVGRDDRNRILGWANPGAYGAHPINSYTPSAASTYCIDIAMRQTPCDRAGRLLATSETR